ncbi:unnamed protein product [Microthlaspi erraticum]|uniref:F-box domain-containing protein n=1 Tax=Microthlaspi erraticum TaxID=1685480 RepID=A0A6D2HWH5_9BRAS|nr:unnamed protein product [Microthlaspi erraticum]
METSNLSMLPLDIIRSLLERLSFIDLQRAKTVCSNWLSGSKETVPCKTGSPWLILSTDNGGSVLYNPDEDKVYKSLRDYSGTCFFANSGKWFLLLDSQTNLYIVDVFSDKRIDLPPLENLLSTTYTIERVGDKEFKRKHIDGVSSLTLRADVLRGLLWVDEKKEDYIVVYFFDTPAAYLSFCKKGDDYYTDIPLRSGVPKLLIGLTDVVLRDYCLYIFSYRCYVRVLDLSGQKGFVDVSESVPYHMRSPRTPYFSNTSIAVTRAGEVLLVESITTGSHVSFYVYKKDPNVVPLSDPHRLVEVHSLGDEALLLDLGITVPANHDSLGVIKPNSIYFTRHDRARLRKSYNLDISVFDFASKTIKHFPGLSNLNLKDARWFLPVTCQT